MSILLSREEAEGHSDIFFDVVKSTNDTVRNRFYELWRDPEHFFIYLKPGETYAVSFLESTNQRFIKANINLKYTVINSAPKVSFYKSTFDLSQVREKPFDRTRLLGRSLIFNELNDSMRVFPDIDAISLAVVKMQNGTSTVLFEELKGMTKEDIENAVVINLINIFPDTASVHLKYRVNTDFFLLYIPSRDHLYFWEESRGYFRKTDKTQLYAPLIYDTIKNNRFWKPDHFFLVSLFPLKYREAGHIIAYKFDNKDSFTYKDVLLAGSYPDFQYLLQYSFFSLQFYKDIYNHRQNVDGTGWWSDIY